MARITVTVPDDLLKQYRAAMRPSILNPGPLQSLSAMVTVEMEGQLAMFEDNTPHWRHIYQIAGAPVEEPTS